MSRLFAHEQRVRFSHCDPAGIVYFPDLFDFAHATMEDWFRDGLGTPLPDLIRDRRIGTPTVSIQGDFSKPLRMGDVLRNELSVLKLGNASLKLDYRGLKDGVDHLHIVQTIAFMDLDAGRAIPVPEDLRPAIESFLAA
jgi:4-hydroxybenzoyl-CoA thioesterase